jgi:putative selenium metabolism hydrolase
MSTSLSGTDFRNVELLVDQAIDLEGLIVACQAVVQVPSLSFEEQDVGLLFASHLKTLGFRQVEIDTYGNVVAVLKGRGGAPSLMINGHIDHVPPGKMEAPYSAEIVDAARWGETGHAIYGRGTCDMKCNVMASAFAIGALLKAGVELLGDVVFVADVAEEVDSLNGVASVIARGVRTDFGISTESTRGQVHIGHRGKLDIELTIHGRTAHASEPANGINSITGANAVLTSLEKYAANLKHDDLLGSATCTVFSIRSSPDNGTAVVPDRCVLRIDRRYIRGETAEICEEELRSVIATALADSETPFDLKVITHYPLMYVDPRSPVVLAALEARQAVTGEVSEIAAWRFGVNGTFMCAAGIPTVGLGPGNEIWAHTPHEHVGVDDLLEACRIWCRLIIRVCGVSDISMKGQQ